MKKRRDINIPTEEEFERASKHMAARIRLGDKLKEMISSECSSSAIYHDVYVWPLKGRCHVDLFVKTKEDKKSEEAERLREVTSRLLSENIQENYQITVDLDSHERVEIEFNGSYYNRFR